MTTIPQLRAFLAASTSGSFSAAGRELGLTQPTVSELVRKLELEHSLDLFVRTGRRLILTAAGEELFPWARRVVEGADGADGALRSLRGIEGGVASFGVLRNAPFYFLSDLAERFHSEHPNVRTRLVGQNSVEVADAVRAGTLEAGLVVLPVADEDLDVRPLMRDEVLWASADPGRTAIPMTIPAIPQRPLILYDAYYGWSDPTRRQLADRAQAAGIRLEPMIEVENIDSALGLVARGVGDTIVSRAVTRHAIFPDGVTTASFADPMFDVIALVTRRNAVLSPVTAELARMARRMILRMRDASADHAGIGSADG